MMKKIFIFYCAVSFLLNFIWEILQVGLYKPHFEGFLGLVLVHLKASLGDVVIALIIFALIALIARDGFWIIKGKTKFLASASIFGFVFAVAIERYALVTGRWGYNDLMPIIPLINVGLFPVLQLAILMPLSVFLTERYFKE
jgi:hypothetical protein